LLYAILILLNMDQSSMCDGVRGREEILHITGKALNVVNGSAVYGRHWGAHPEGFF
jgi:predicted N-acyltransferase